VAPSDEVPAECVEYKPDRFQFPDRDLFLFIRISDLQDFLGRNGVLNARQVIKTLNETYGHLQFDIRSQFLNGIFLRRPKRIFLVSAEE
jgi:hypothetical protein